MRNYFDCETSGFHPWKNSVISLAWVITDDDNNTIDEFYDECAPDLGSKAWDIEAESVHGFKEAEHRLKKPAIELCNNLLSFLAKNKVTHDLIRYHANAYFDTRMLFAMFFKNLEHNYYSIYKHVQPNEHQNTIELIKQRLPGLPSYKLNELADTLGISLQHHNALSDTRCLVSICKEIKI
jgi:DNA polymerase III epsilon subunit-like protein